MTNDRTSSRSSTGVAIERLNSWQVQQRVEQLADLLIDCVDGGASVSFLAPLHSSKAEEFWREVARKVERSEQILLAAVDERDNVVGCVTVVTGLPENQPHRADISKMLVRRSARRRGLGEALMAAAERAAVAAGRPLLVLDTATPEAERLYLRSGFVPVGVIPDFALLPDGSFCSTTFFYKRAGGPSALVKSRIGH